MKKNAFLLLAVLPPLLAAGAVLPKEFRQGFAKLPSDLQEQEVFYSVAPSCRLDASKPNSPDGRAIVSRSFYILYKNQLAPYLGKNITARMKVRRMAGTDPLSLSFRVLGDKAPVCVNSITLNYPVDGVWHDAEISCLIPNVEGIDNVNVQAGIYCTGTTPPTVWLLDEIRAEEGGGEGMREIPGESIGVAQLHDREPLPLVKDGRPLFSIVVAESPNDVALFAAEEIQEHAFLATGTRPPILRGAKRPGPAIWVGDTSLSRRYDCHPAMFSPDAWCNIRVGEDVIISGGDQPHARRKGILSRAVMPLGTLFAAYEFLERHFGARWFWPGENGTLAPPVRDLAIRPRLYDCGKPTYSCRTHFFEHSLDKDLPNDVIYRWHRRIRSGGADPSPIGMHSFQDWPQKHADQPELFALQSNGERKVNGLEGIHLCLTNPKTIELSARDIIEFFQAHPSAKFRPAMPGDSNTLYFCRCENCARTATPEKGPDGIHSNAVWAYVNAVARLVAKECPGKYVKCCAYSDYRLPPDFPIEPNVAVTLCLNPSPQGSNRCKEGWQSQIQAWAKTGAVLYAWEYWDVNRIKYGTYGTPAVYARQLQELYMLDCAYVRGRALELPCYDYQGKDVRSWADWPLDLPTLYIAGKLMWNVSTDVDGELERYFRDFFGPAEPEIREFHTAMEEAWLHSVWTVAGEQVKSHETSWTHTYPPDFVDRMMALLRRVADKTRGQQPYEWRVGKLLEAYARVEHNSRVFRSLAAKKITIPSFTLPRTPAPVIDGQVNPQEWQDAVRIDGFGGLLGHEQVQARTELLLKQDGQNLYVAAVAHPIDPKREIKFVNQEWGRDAFLWKGESVELLFAAPNGDRDQFIIAPENKLFDARWTSDIAKFDFAKACPWNPPVEFATSACAPEWTMEIAIPLKVIRVNQVDGRRWLLANFCRNHYSKSNPDDRQFQPEHSLWSSGGGTDNVKVYGRFELE